MRILNLYAGLGGNRKLWKDCQVTAVEKSPEIAAVYKSLHPKDSIVIGAAHEYLLQNYDKYDFIWASPPCQSHSRMMKATRHDVRKYPNMMLYQEIILLQHFCKTKFVVENVKPYYEPLIKPNAILGRHYFWSNFHIPQFKIPGLKNFITNEAGSNKVEDLKNWLGIHYDGNLYYEGNHEPSQVLRNCVHPDLGLHIFERMKRSKNKTKSKPDIEQLKLPL